MYAQCYIHAGKEPWVNLLALINEKSTADLDIKAKAMSLINRVSTEVILYHTVTVADTHQIYLAKNVV